jgi:two-component system CheB/CheR fusion protein
MKRKKKPSQAPGAKAPATEPEKPPEGIPPEMSCEEAARPETPEKRLCPVIGVGASAGGLEALQGLLDHVPRDLKAAFVVVQHRATDRTSVMQSLLEKHTDLTVKDIQDGMKIEPGTVYLSPADKDVSILNGVLFCTNVPARGGIHLPIDSFLRSLAREQAERAVGIILSGTGSDGTLGVKDIKAAGGMVMAQEETQAKYDSMPRSAIDTGMVDFVLPVEKMGGQLAQYLSHPFLTRRKAPDMENKFESGLQKIFVLIRTQTGQDFSHYKRNTIQRRIARRLAVHQIENLDHYVRLLQEHPEEAKTLARELLITVTNFFRDRQAIQALTESVIRPLIEQKPTDSAFRVWVAGCATGEEAYSVAMLLHEQITKSDKRFNVQIFATDIDDESIEVARRGLYPKSIASDVSPGRLKRFFTEENNSYRIKSAVREMLVFAKHNLIKDASFSKLDIVCCRNVLIYMDSTLQKRLIPLFHYTLNPGGFLFLGESESIGTFADLFAPVDARHKIFKRKPAETGYEPEARISFYPQGDRATEERTKAKKPQDINKIAEKIILRDYSMPCVLVDEEFNAVYFNGDTSKYLIQPGGRPTFNLVQMARPEIHYKLALLLRRAFKDKRTAEEKDLQIRVNDHHLEVDIVARPVIDAGLGDNLMLVVFRSKQKEKKPGDGSAAPVNLPDEEKDVRIREVEQELQSTREDLQTTIEELETSNEELKSSNEELQSMNEELQSTNEELDTSREELQSTNEELRTINSEHQQKIDELSEAYDDLNNLLAATEVATLFLDRELKIRRFTPAARKLFRLIDRDIGRPLSDISSNVKHQDLGRDIRTAIENLNRIEKEVRVEGEETGCYQMRIVPYRTAENVIGGGVVTFVNIADYKRAVLAAEEAARFAEAVVETIREPLLILDTNLKVVDANPAFYRFFCTSGSETTGRRVYELGDQQWDIADLRRLLEKIVPENTKFEDFRVTHEFPQIGERTMLLNARQTMRKGEATGRVLLAFEDITGKS